MAEPDQASTTNQLGEMALPLRDGDNLQALADHTDHVPACQPLGGALPTVQRSCRSCTMSLRRTLKRPICAARYYSVTQAIYSLTLFTAVVLRLLRRGYSLY